jgi:hypothetical protein
MKTGTVLALVGVGLAAIDVSGLARYVEIAVRKAMGPLRAWGRSMTEQETILQRLLTLVAVALIALFLVTALVQWLFGIAIVPEVTTTDGTRQNALLFAAGQLMLAVNLVIVLGALALGLWCVLWALAWPRKGVVSALGFVLALVALAYELFQ